MPLTLENAIFGHVSEDTALLVDDYPYGFKLRTSIRYWIETKGNKGDRFVSQTLNPKTGQWNKPKASTYSHVMVLFREDETGHIKSSALTHYSDDEKIAHFREVTNGKLSPTQIKNLAEIIGMKKAMEGVTIEFRTTEPTDEEKDEQARIETLLQRRAAYAIHAAEKEITNS